MTERTEFDSHWANEQFIKAEAPLEDGVPPQTQSDRQRSLIKTGTCPSGGCPTWLNQDLEWSPKELLQFVCGSETAPELGGFSLLSYNKATTNERKKTLHTSQGNVKPKRPKYYLLAE